MSKDHYVNICLRKVNFKIWCRQKSHENICMTEEMIFGQWQQDFWHCPIVHFQSNIWKYLYDWGNDIWPTAARFLTLLHCAFPTLALSTPFQLPPQHRVQNHRIDTPATSKPKQICWWESCARKQTQQKVSIMWEEAWQEFNWQLIELGKHREDCCPVSAKWAPSPSPPWLVLQSPCLSFVLRLPDNAY